MLRIKLSRTGSKNHPNYRIVVAPDRSKLSGKSVEVLGYFLPFENKLKVEKGRFEHWLKLGAIPTEKIKRLFKLS